MYASSALEARPADGEGLIDNELLPAPQPLPCLITINGTEIEARTGDSILAAARRAGISIPSMCADPRIKPSGGCGLCVVEIEGQAGPVKACATAVYEGVAVETETPRLKKLRQARLNDYLANHNAYCTPPCQAACPAGIDIAGYIALIGNGQYVEATALIKQRLPLPGILGRVCPRPCEDHCRRQQIDGQAVAICDLKRFAADRARAAGQPTQPKPKSATGKRVAIVGRDHPACRQPTTWRSKVTQVNSVEAEQSLAARCASAFQPIAYPTSFSTRRSATFWRLALK